MEKEILDRLIDKINKGEATDDELGLYNAYMNHLSTGDTDWAESRPENNIREELWSMVQPVILKTPHRRVVLWQRIAVAASILLFLSIGGYFLLLKKEPLQVARVQKNDILPGHNQATLTLSNGQKIVLKKGLTGKLASQGNTLIQINNKSMVSYTATRMGIKTPPVEYNTLSTSKGEQSPFPLELADGTKVWLNAMSSITFPTNFKGKDRTVKITGEVFFEVTHNTIHPFKVIVKGQTIEDVGTQFNVNAYDDEATIKTTLLEGSIKVNSAKESVLIKPGQQALLTNTEGLEIKNDVNTEEITAWKNGFFEFNDTDVQTIMRQIVRWYDVDVTFAGKIPANKFYGKIPRNVNASVVLNVLKLSGINFIIEGRKVIVK